MTRMYLVYWLDLTPNILIMTFSTQGWWNHFYGRFVLEPTEGCPKEVCDMMTVSPSHGNLGPVDRPLQVTVSMKFILRDPYQLISKVWNRILSLLAISN